MDSRTTAVIHIDLMNALMGMPVQPHSAADVVAQCARLSSKIREGGGVPVYVRVNMKEFKRHEADEQMAIDPSKMPPNATELVAGCGFQNGDVEIVKMTWGAFIGTDLDEKLKVRGIKTIVMTGIATNFGVESTARSAYDLGYDLVFAEDAMSSMAAEAHEFAVKRIFPRMGRVRSTDQIVDGL